MCWCMHACRCVCVCAANREKVKDSLSKPAHSGARMSSPSRHPTGRSPHHSGVKRSSPSPRMMRPNPPLGMGSPPRPGLMVGGPPGPGLMVGGPAVQRYGGIPSAFFPPALLATPHPIQPQPQYGQQPLQQYHHRVPVRPHITQGESSFCSM